MADIVKRSTSNFQSGLLTIAEKEHILDIIKTLGNGKNLKIDNHADALALVIKAKELNLPMGTALDHCFIINGRVGIDVHIAKAILLKSKCVTWTRIKDYEPVMNYTNGVVILTEEQLPKNYILVSKINNNEVEINKLKADGKYPVAILSKEGVPIISDYVTTYKFERIIQLTDGSSKTITEVSSFKFSDATVAGLYTTETSASSPWRKYTAKMVDHRAFMNGARAIADDMLLGMYSTIELLDSDNLPYEVTVDGEAIEVKD